MKLREELDKKSIGDVLSVNALFGHVEWRDRGFKKDLGGGTTLDMAVYCIQANRDDFFSFLIFLHHLVILSMILSRE